MLTLLGCLCLGVAAVLAPSQQAERTWVSALGSSLGGARVLVANALYLHAEHLESRGRVEDAAAALDLLLELDPRNDAATSYLMDVYVRTLLPQVPGEADRLAWWREARRLLDRALLERPRSARLHLAAADLLLLPPASVAARVQELEPQSVRAGVAHLLRAARITAEIPRAGRRHLIQLASVGTLLAAQDLVAGDLAEATALVEGLEEILGLYPAVLAEIAFDPEALGAGPSLGQALGAMLAVLRPLLSTPIDANTVRQALAKWEQDLGPRSGPLAAEVRRLLDGPR